MHVVVLGGGSLGSLIAGRLAGHGPVTLLDHDRAHIDAIRSIGLAITNPDGSVETVTDLEATTDPGDVRGPDLVVVCVKSYHTAEATREASEHYLDSDTPVLTLQNGLGNAETIATMIPESNVYAGTTGHGAKREVPGRVRHAGHGSTVIGRYFEPPGDTLEAIVNRFDSGGFAVEPIEEIRDAIWEKLLINSGINAATALARVPNGAMSDSEAGQQLLARAIREGLAVAAAEGRTVDEDVLDTAISVARRTASNHSSMWMDLETGSRTEIDAINGAIVERATAHELEAPVNETLLNLVHLAESQQPGD